MCHKCTFCATSNCAQTAGLRGVCFLNTPLHYLQSQQRGLCHNTGPTTHIYSDSFILFLTTISFPCISLSKTSSNTRWKPLSAEKYDQLLSAIMQSVYWQQGWAETINTSWYTVRSNSWSSVCWSQWGDQVWSGVCTLRKRGGREKNKSVAVVVMPAFLGLTHTHKQPCTQTHNC